MSGNNGGFGVDLEALQAASEGVQSAVDELNDMGGWTAGSTNQGADGHGLMDGIQAALQDIGHDELTQAINEFGKRWNWGIRMMVDEAVSTTEALTDTRSTYQQAEDAVVGFLKDSAQWAVDPMADGSASEGSWGELGQETLDKTFRDPGDPDRWREAAAQPAQVFQGITGLGGGDQQ